MDPEAGIRAHQDMITVEEYKTRRAAGIPPEHTYNADIGDTPVIQVVVTMAEKLANDTMKYAFALPDGAPLPPTTAGSHIDVVVAPEFFRQYSLANDPADRSTYKIAVLREDAGRGGSKLMHRIFEPGRKVFISKPVNHFPLDETATCTYLMGGGIGVTPMMAMAHRLHAIGANFELHYSAPTRARAAFLSCLSNMPWVHSVHLHISDEGNRIDLPAALAYAPGTHLYTCGPDAYMQAVTAAAATNGFPDKNIHREYFTPPETPEYENFPFTLHLAKSGRDIPVTAGQSAADALQDAGIHIDVKCADGLCGVCKCRVLSGQVEHRDFVLSNAARAQEMVLCQSRAADENGTLVIDL
jgi:ferredoxin-NADP reductase